ncbi:protein eva-1 homolog C isoform X2 [Scleropages formosus]|uniref:Si:ch73-335m24.2 n=1 Tax=Scleropages formosus TaxID=113540 RepID=A0A8C9RC28_SCLFO|nr:protein eva-1 homolog C-like isoform X2 [Scleropages formosus]
MLAWRLLCLHLWLVTCAREAWTAPDFSAYLHRILRNHTAHACDGETLTISCPSKTSVAVLSAFYGRHVPSENLCPARNANITEEDTDCMSPVAVQKVADECQERRTCHIPVINHVFGLDPCPGTSKYLIVSYKCRPENHRSKLVCENERLRLACRNDTVLAIYSATFGHQLHGSPRCPQEPTGAPDIECLSPSALRRVSRRCHGRTNCSLVADTQGFGDPCFPGVRKQLRVSFTCVPKYLLEDVGRGSTDPFSIADYTHGVPEKVALYFVSGICSGLVFLLCLFGLKSTVTRDIKGLFSDLRDELKATQEPHPELTEDDDDTASESSFYRLTRSYRMADVFPPDLMVGVEGREQEEDEEPLKELPSSHIWPHRDSSPYAVHKLKSSSA